VHANVQNPGEITKKGKGAKVEKSKARYYN
jgi:hypothetical protein